MAHDDIIDKLWLLCRNKMPPSGTQRVIVVDRRTGEKLVSKQLPKSGDWVREGFVNCCRYTLPEDRLSEDHLAHLDIHIEKEDGDWVGADIAVWLTRINSQRPFHMWHCASADLSSDHACVLLKSDSRKVEKLAYIDLLVETAYMPYWFGWDDSGSYPNQFMFVVTTGKDGLVLSEVFPEGPGQKMEGAVTARFRFLLPIPISYSEFTHTGRMVIKAKGTNLWRPRHILALGVSTAATKDVMVLGGRLNIDDLRLTNEPGDRAVPHLEIPSWMYDG